MNKKSYTILFLLAIAMLIIPNATEALGIGVKPDKIDLEVKVGEIKEAKILVSNIGDKPAFYKVYPDSLDKEVTIKPTEFRLEPNGSQWVSINAEFKQQGNFNTSLSVVAYPPEAKSLTTASGVKVPLTITATGFPFWLKLLSLILLFSICVIPFFVLKLEHKSKHENHS